MYVDCRCGQEVKAADNAAGTLRTCPACGERFRFPKLDEARRTPATSAASAKFASQAGAHPALSPRPSRSLENISQTIAPDLSSCPVVNVAAPPLPSKSAGHPVLVSHPSSSVATIGQTTVSDTFSTIKLILYTLLLSIPMAGFGYFIWHEAQDPQLRWYADNSKLFWALAIAASIYLAWIFDANTVPRPSAVIRTVRFTSAIPCGSCWLVLVPLFLLSVFYWPYVVMRDSIREGDYVGSLEYGNGLSRVPGYYFLGLMFALISCLVAVGLNVMAIYSGTIPYLLAKHLTQKEAAEKVPGITASPAETKDRPATAKAKLPPFTKTLSGQ